MIYRSKEDIRETVLKDRLNIATDEMVLCSKVIVQNCYSICKSFKKIYMYMPIKNEVDLTELVSKSVTDGKEIFLPSIIEENITFRRYVKGNVLSSGRYGILEADGKISTPDSESIIIIPAVAFDLNCNRIGYGAGYYDRYLADYLNVLKVGVVYDFQLVEKIDYDLYDIPVDIVITEKREVRRKK